MSRILILILTLVTTMAGDPVPSAYKFDWQRNVTVGVTGGIVPHSGTPRYVHETGGADITGVTNTALIVSNLYFNVAVPGDYLYFTNGTYLWTNNLVLTRSGIGFRGQSTNVNILILSNAPAAAITLQPAQSPSDASSNTQYIVTSALPSGSTNFTVASATDSGGQPITAGGIFSISMETRSVNSDDWPILDIFNQDRLINHPVVIHSVTAGTNITLRRPLGWGFTNAPILYRHLGPVAPRAISNVAFENITFTLTNHVTHQGNAVCPTILLWDSVTDSWVTNCNFHYANNYGISTRRATAVEFSHNNFTSWGTGGSSKAGMILQNSSYILVENNTCFQIYPFIEINNSHMGAFCWNFGTNNTAQDILFHATHDMFNLVEHNWMETGFQYDGNSGSRSHQVFFRNKIRGPFAMQMKRWNTRIAVVANILGSTNFDYLYYSTNTGTPRMIMEVGRPNIGNLGFDDYVPPRSRIFPGTNYLFGASDIHNGYTFTNDQINTTNLVGDFTWLTNIPSSFNSYTLIIQDGAFTNKYYSVYNVRPVASLQLFSVATTTNIVVNLPVSVTNGNTIYVAGGTAYQMLDTGLIDLNTITVNGVYTNLGYAVVIDSAIADTNLVSSYLGRPGWMTASYPALPLIGPDVDGLEVSIPARDRFYGLTPAAIHSVTTRGITGFRGKSGVR